MTLQGFTKHASYHLDSESPRSSGRSILLSLPCMQAYNEPYNVGTDAKLLKWKYGNMNSVDFLLRSKAAGKPSETRQCSVHLLKGLCAVPICTSRHQCLHLAAKAPPVLLQAQNCILERDQTSSCYQV